MIAESGVAGVTHRLVSERAGVPLARVSYHFPTIQALLSAATTRYLADFDRRLTSMAAEALAESRPLDQAAAEFLTGLITDEPDELLAMVEVRLALHRRGLVVDDDRLVATLSTFGLPPDPAGSIVASLFGFAFLAATTDAPVTYATVYAHVQTVFRGAGFNLSTEETSP